ncbi:MAG: copper chaperone PCu(A)C [Pseudobdellovibrionaceae bacterium]
MKIKISMKTMLISLITTLIVVNPSLLMAKPPVAAILKKTWNLTNARVYAPVAGAKATAGYFELENFSDQPVTVEFKSMAPFKHVETHETVKENEQAKMIQVDKFEVGPRSKLELVPGGKHLMLFEPKTEVKSGQMLQGLLKVGEKTTTVDFKVIDREIKKTEDHSHH